MAKGGLAVKKATLNQASKILQIFEKTPSEKLQEIIESGVLSDLRDGDFARFNRNEFRKMLNLGFSKSFPFPTFTLLINYDRGVKAGIRSGHYDYVNPYITENNFPTIQQGVKEVAVQLVHFSKIKMMSTDQVLIELDKMNLRPANIQELLSLGEKHPNLQREYPIIALGSVCRSFDGHLTCPILGSDSSGCRRISFDWVEDGWGGICRFAAVSR
jgi:hypothetical protein